MVHIRNISEIENNDTVELFDNNDKSLGTILTGLVLTDVCVQIKTNCLDGYYIMYNGRKIDITSDGRIYTSGPMPFRALGDLLRELF